MTGYPAIGAVGTDSLAYNPYLYADSLGYANLSQYNTDSIPYSNPVMGTTSPSFQGLSSDSLNASYNYANTSTEKKGGVNPWVVTAGVTLLTVGAACYLRGRGVNANGSFLEKLKAGGEANWKSITNFFKGGEKAAAEAVEGAGKNATQQTMGNALQFRQVNGEWVVTLPEKTKTIGGKQQEIIKRAENLGIKINKDLTCTNKAVTIESTTVEMTLGGKKVTALYKNGEFSQLKYADTGKAVKEAKELELAEKEFARITKAIESRNTKTLGRYALQDINYSTVVDGANVNYRMHNLTATPEVANIVTNRYLAKSSKTVSAYADTNAVLDAQLKSIKNGNPNFEGWGLTNGTYKPEGKTWEIVIKDGQISGVNKGGKFYATESTTYSDLHRKHETLFDDALNHPDKFTNVTYTFPG